MALKEFVLNEQREPCPIDNKSCCVPPCRRQEANTSSHFFDETDFSIHDYKLSYKNLLSQLTNEKTTLVSGEEIKVSTILFSSNQKKK